MKMNLRFKKKKSKTTRQKLPSHKSLHDVRPSTRTNTNKIKIKLNNYSLSSETSSPLIKTSSSSGATRNDWKPKSKVKLTTDAN